MGISNLCGKLYCIVFFHLTLNQNAFPACPFFGLIKAKNLNSSLRALFHSLYPICQQKWLALSVKLYPESIHFSPNLPSWFKLPSLYPITVIF